MNKLKKVSTVAITLVMSLSIFSGCSSGKTTTINVLNYGENIGEGLIEEFEEEYDVKVNYKTFDEMEEMYIEVASGKAEYDAVLVSDYMADRMIQEGLLQKLNKDNIENLNNMSENDLGQSYDINNDYTVPFMNGSVGIIYNKDVVKEDVNSWDIMWNDNYNKQIFVLDSQRDAIGMALKKLGYSLNSTDINELNEAKETLIDQRALSLTWGSDEVQDLVISGEVAIAMIWSGEGLNLAAEHENLEYIIPKEGANYWIDSWAIPYNAKEKEMSEKFINFVSGKDEAFRTADEIGYTSPNKLTIQMQDDEIKNNKYAYLDEEMIEKVESYKYLTQDELKLYDEVWTKVKTAK